MSCILITGCNGMIGSALTRELLNKGYTIIGIDKKNNSDISDDENKFKFYNIDLFDTQKLSDVFKENDISHVIHLAALAHTNNEGDLSWDTYYKINVTSSVNIFTSALENNCNLLFISTIDVYGITSGVVTSNTECKPISNYAKSKYLAEEKLKELCINYNKTATVYRLSPVYTDEIKRDIQKRYYIKYPHIAYRIGKGIDYEFLYIHNAISSFVKWVETYEAKKTEEGSVNIAIIKDPKPINTAKCLLNERKNGKAKVIIYIPYWCIKLIYGIAKKIAGKTNLVFLLSKVVNPIKTNNG